MNQRARQALDFVTAVMALIAIAHIVRPPREQKKWQKSVRKSMYDMYMRHANDAVWRGDYENAAYYLTKAMEKM